MSAQDGLRLQAVLGDHPHSLPLKRGDISSDRLAFDFLPVSPITAAFRPMVREQRYDFCEIAIVTYLQAKSLGKPLVLLPAVMSSRFQQPYLGYDSALPALGPTELSGRRIGVRSYAQTTAVWLRGILEEDYGVAPSSVTWVTLEESHLAEYDDPPWAMRAAPGKKLIGMLFDGEVDAIVGEFKTEPRIKPVIPRPQEAARDWYRRKGIIQINHMMAATAALARERPWAIGETYRLLAEGKRIAPSGEFDATPFGIDAVWPALSAIIDHSVRQGIIPRHLGVEELFDVEV